MTALRKANRSRVRQVHVTEIDVAVSDWADGMLLSLVLNQRQQQIERPFVTTLRYHLAVSERWSSRRAQAARGVEIQKRSLVLHNPPNLPRANYDEVRANLAFPSPQDNSHRTTRGSGVRYSSSLG